MKDDIQARDDFLQREKKALLENLRSEFSTPLDVIIGYGEVLFEELTKLSHKNLEFKEENAKNRDDLKRILDGAKTLQKEVDDAFEMASLSSKKQELDLTEFIKLLHHTLLTPLNSIIGYTELLVEEGFERYGPQMNQDLKRIHDAGQIFIQYIQHIAEVAKTQFEGGDLLNNYKTLSQIIHNVVSSIPSLDQNVIIQESKEGTVLIVDDNSMELDLLVRRVEYYGYSAVPCNHGGKVLEMLEERPYDLVLLQIIMAEVNGFEVLKLIKKNDKFRHLPIIVISPLKELDAVVRCFELGADDYLPKPFHSVIFKARVNNCIEKKKLIDLEREYFRNLQQEKEKSEQLLLNIFPLAIVNRLKNGKEFIADRMENTTILFADIVNFSGLAEKLGPQELITALNKVFSMIDSLIDKYQIEKIKTIGDSYMAAAGVPIPNINHAESIASLALDILKGIEIVNCENAYHLHLRIGINSGPVVAGIIGAKKFNYDLWGATVNLASRMESQGSPDKIQVTEDTYQLLKDKFEFTYRGEVEAKGIGIIKTYFLICRKEAESIP